MFAEVIIATAMSGYDLYSSSFEACAGAPINLTCNNGAKIEAVTSRYGRWNNSVCPHSSVNASTPPKWEVYSDPSLYKAAIGKDSYSGPLPYAGVVTDPYPGVFKQMQGTYKCVYPLPATVKGYSKKNYGVYTAGSNIATPSLTLDKCIDSCNADPKCKGVSWNSSVPNTSPFQCSTKSTLEGDVRDNDPQGWVTYVRPPASAPPPSPPENGGGVDNKTGDKSNDLLMLGMMGGGVCLLLVLFVAMK